MTLTAKEPVHSLTDPDAYMHNDFPQRIHPDLTAITELCASISNGICELGYRGLQALTLERKMYGALVGELIGFHAHGALIEVIQQFHHRVCEQIENVIDPRRQPDLLEQPHCRNPNCGAVVEDGMPGYCRGCLNAGAV
jgi:hypothetical protein